MHLDHLIGSPLALASSSFAKKAWVKFSDIPNLQRPNVKFVLGSVTHVDCANKTATTIDSVTKAATTHSYDYFVAATGLRRVWPTVPQSLTRKAYLLEAEEQIHAASIARHGVVVVGGGAVGIEMAAELKLVQPHVKVTLAHSRDELLSAEALSKECKDASLALTREAGVEVLLNHRLKNTAEVEDGYELEFENGHKMLCSDVFMAVSKPVSTATYLPQSALDSDNLVKINPKYVRITTYHRHAPNCANCYSLSFVDGTPNAASHFCAGDVAKWSGIKRCGGAMHGGHFAAQNIHQSMLQKLTGNSPEHKELGVFEPMIGLAIGKKAVASSPEGTTFGEDVMQSYFRDDLGFTSKLMDHQVRFAVANKCSLLELHAVGRGRQDTVRSVFIQSVINGK